MDRWTIFLDTAAKLYKHLFLIYDQRPEARACVDYAPWNEWMKGFMGLTLLDCSVDELLLLYVFDVVDTEGARRPYLW